MMSPEQFAALPDEKKRAFMMSHHPQAMPLGQVELAKAEHACRELNHSTVACDRLSQGVRGACDACLIAAGLKKD